MSLDYAARQIAGVWKMAWNSDDWTASLDRSVDGVFRSFWAMALAAPIALVGFISVRRAAERMTELAQAPLLDAPLPAALTIEMIAYVVDWTAGLAALIFAARSLGLAKRVGDIIIGYNWLQVLVAAGQSIPLLILSFTTRSGFGAVFAIPAAALIILLYWGVLRRSTGAGAAAVIGVFAALVIVGFLASSLTASLCLAVYKALS